MKPRTLPALLVTALLGGCSSYPAAYPPPGPPPASVGEEADWRPYPPPPRAVPAERPRASETDWSRRVPADGDIVRRELPAPDVSPDRPFRPYAGPSPESGAMGGGTAAAPQPKAPPADFESRRRHYSSRPDRNARFERERSAFGDGQPSVSARQPQVRSEWADKAVRPDNRPAFDDMVRQSARNGTSEFEDEAGRVYYGERRGADGGCTAVEVTVTTRGGLPIVARGTALACG